MQKQINTYIVLKQTREPIEFLKLTYEYIPRSANSEIAKSLI